MRLVELDGAEGVGERGEHAARCADRAELMMVADQHEFDTMTASKIHEAIEVSGGEHAGFVDDDHVAWGEHPAGGRGAVVVPVEELGDGLRRHTGLATQHVGGCRGVGEADHLVARARPGAGGDASIVVLPVPAGPTTTSSRRPRLVTVPNASCWSVPSGVRSHASARSRVSAATSPVPAARPICAACRIRPSTAIISWVVYRGAWGASQTLVPSRRPERGRNVNSLAVLGDIPPSGWPGPHPRSVQRAQTPGLRRRRQRDPRRGRPLARRRGG